MPIPLPPSRLRRCSPQAVRLAFATVLVLGSAGRAAVGPDPTFHAELEATARIVDAAPYTNGTFLVVGDFHRIGGARHNHLARLDTNGVPVPGFHAAIDGDAIVSSVAVQADGRILVSGAFPRVGGSDNGGVIRLMPDGQPDASFHFDGAIQDGFRLCRVGLDPAGRIHLASYLGNLIEVLRLEADGQVEADRTLRADCYLQFRPDLRAPQIHVLADGRYYLAGDFDYLWGMITSSPRIGHVIRLRPDGTPDPTFDTFLGFRTDGSPFDIGVHASAILPDGRLLLGGQFSSFNGHARPGILALNPDGSLDLGFRPQGLDAAVVEAVLPQADGSIIAGGVFRVAGEILPRMLVRLRADGTLDFTFGAPEARPDFTQAVLSLVSVGGDRIGVAGQGIGPGEACPGAVAVRGADGQSVGVTPPIAVTPGWASYLTPTPDGSLYVAGNFQLVNGVARSGFARLLADGSVDPAYNASSARGHFGPMALLPDGSLLVQGLSSFGLPLVDKLDANGNRAAGFSVGALSGNLVGILPRADGDILLWGHFQGSPPWQINSVPPFEGPLALLAPDGTRRTNAIPKYGDLSSISTLLPLSDGSFLADGLPLGVLRLSRDYTKDTEWMIRNADLRTFTFSGVVRALASDSLGRVILGGYFDHLGTNAVPGLGRIFAHGTIDTSWAPALAVGSTQEIRVGADDRITALGSFTTGPEPDDRASVIRLLPDGRLDPEFPTIGPTAMGIALRGDDLYVSLIDRTIPSEPSGRVIRYNPRPVAPTLHWTWTPSSRALVLDTGAGGGATRWEMSIDLKTWTPVPGNSDGATLLTEVPDDDPPRFFRAVR